MRVALGIPIVVRNVKISGPKGSLGVDLIYDSGAVFTALSWSVLKVIGYDPAVVPEAVGCGRGREAVALCYADVNQRTGRRLRLR